MCVCICTTQRSIQHARNTNIHLRNSIIYFRSSVISCFSLPPSHSIHLQRIHTQSEDDFNVISRYMAKQQPTITWTLFIFSSSSSTLNTDIWHSADEGFRLLRHPATSPSLLTSTRTCTNRQAPLAAETNDHLVHLITVRKRVHM